MQKGPQAGCTDGRHVPRVLKGRAWPLVETVGSDAGRGAVCSTLSEERTTSADCSVRFCRCSVSFSCCSASSCTARSTTRFSVSACFACAARRADKQSVHHRAPRRATPSLSEAGFALGALEGKANAA